MKKQILIIGSVFLTSMSTFALNFSFSSDIRNDAKYYLRYSETNGSVGGSDDEGYCKIGTWTASNHNSQNGHHVIRKGEVLRLLGDVKDPRKVVYFNNQVSGTGQVSSTATVIEVEDTLSLLELKDGTQVSIGCSIDTSASERSPYQPIQDAHSKAYLKALNFSLMPKR